MQRNDSAFGQHHTTFACLRMYIYVVSECAPSRRAFSTSPAGLGGAEKEILDLLLHSPALEVTQTSRVFSRWTVTTWPAWLDWPSGPPVAQLVRHWKAA